MEKAKAEIEKAVELNPKKAGVYYCIFAESIRNNTGDKRTAAVYYKKSVELGGDCYEAKEAKKQLAEWGM
jgi:Tfp pilus assembly protein PilF